MANHIGTETRQNTLIKINMVKGFWNLCGASGQHSRFISILGGLSWPSSTSRSHLLAHKMFPILNKR